MLFQRRPHCPSVCVVILFLMVAIIVSFIFAVNAFWTALNTYTVSFVRSHGFCGNNSGNPALFFRQFGKNAIRFSYVHHLSMNISNAVPAFCHLTPLVDNAGLCPAHPAPFRRIAACFFTVFFLK